MGLCHAYQVLLGDRDSFTVPIDVLPSVYRMRFIEFLRSRNSARCDIDRENST